MARCDICGAPDWADHEDPECRDDDDQLTIWELLGDDDGLTDLSSCP